jgi:hypothetical protein
MACSLFVDTDGLQDGSNDASSAADVLAPDVNLVDSGVTDTSPPIDKDVVPPDSGPAAGPITFVQKTDFDPGDDASVGNLTLAPVAPGDTILVCVVFSGTGTAQVTDDKGDAFTAVVGPFGSSQGTVSYIFAAIGVLGNEQSIHVEFTGPKIYTELYALEYRGIKAFDVGTTAYGTGGLAKTPNVFTAVANELLFAFGVDDIVTVGSGFTARDTANSDLVEDQIAGAAGSYDATATMSNAGVLLLAAFR